MPAYLRVRKNSDHNVPAGYIFKQTTALIRRKSPPFNMGTCKIELKLCEQSGISETLKCISVTVYRKEGVGNRSKIVTRGRYFMSRHFHNSCRQL